MKKFLSALIPLVCLLAVFAFGADKPPLRLVQTITIPDLKGRIDHMDIDVKGQRLFVAGLENGSLEVVDLAAGKWLRSIPGFKKPQGVWFVPELNKVFVVSGDDGMLRVFAGDNLQLLDAITLEAGANRVAYDPKAKIMYVGYGGKDAGKDYGEVGIVDAKSDKHTGDIKVAAHPAEVLLNNSGKTIFTCIPATSQVQVLDTAKAKVTASWPTGSERPGDMAFDERTHRLFVGTHKPPELVVFDTQSGQKVANLPTVEGLDGVYFDENRKRVYISGGRGFDVGFVYVHQMTSGDHYDVVGKIPTRPGAGTSFWSPQLNRYYVAAPAYEGQPAAILVFEPQR